MFALEAFRAQHGDALLLHYGTRAAPLWALIDGGPSGTWATSVRPRLQQLREDRAVPLRWIMLSHVDDDHVRGLLDLFTELDDAMPRPERATAATAALFHNTPGPPAPQAGVAGGGPASTPDDPVRAAVEEAIAGVAAAQPEGMGSVASYQQGADLANKAHALGAHRNPQDGHRLLAGDLLPSAVVAPLRVTVVSPSPETVDRLLRAWEAELGEGGGVVASVEKKIQNLSSIVVLIEGGPQGEQRMLLTGDALDLDVIRDLDGLGLLDDNGQMHVDLLKLPHHGSRANCHDELFATIKAEHYVISANGRHGNPDVETLERLVASERDREITIWITNGPDDGEDSSAQTLGHRFATLDSLIQENGATGIQVRHPGPEDLSVTIAL